MVRENELIRDKNYKINFGKKFKGRTIEEVMAEWGGPNYLVWCHENDEYLPWFELHCDLLQEVEDMI